MTRCSSRSTRAPATPSSSSTARSPTSASSRPSTSTSPRTRKEEILLSPDELAVTIKLRRVLHALEAQQAIDLLLDRLRKTRTNIEFLMQIAKTTPGQD